MKYKIGDKVRIRDGLEDGVKYSGITYWKAFKEREYIIKGFIEKVGLYLCTNEGMTWYFSEEMLEPVQTGGVVNKWCPPPYHANDLIISAKEIEKA